MTLDQYIAALVALRAEHGGDIPVRAMSDMDRWYGPARTPRLVVGKTHFSSIVPLDGLRKHNGAAAFTQPYQMEIEARPDVRIIGV